VQQQRMRTAGARASSKVKRWFLGLLLRLPGSNSSDPASLLARFPDEALLPLRRNGLDPVPELCRIREQEPVSRVKMPLGLRGWLVTGYEESKAVLSADTETFSNDFSNMVGKVGIAAEDDPGGLGFADPPAHTRLRHMLTAHFTLRASEQRAPRIQQVIDTTLDELERAGEGGATVDLQKFFSLPIPSRVIMELLGIDDKDREEFERLSATRFDFAGGAVGSLDVIQESIDYLRRIVERQRVNPQPGLIGTILTEYGDDVDDVELAGLADGVLTGGLETTVSMLSLGAVALLRDPELAAAIRDGDSKVEAFVEELLRYLTVVQVGFPRFAVKDITIGGKLMLKGDVVVPSLSGANRDARRGTAMDQIDVDRPVIHHLAFGHGLHRCVGAELARVELRMAYPGLVRRFPNMRLGVAPEDLAYRDLSIVYGLQELPVVLS
jgi:cytochrome P450